MKQEGSSCEETYTGNTMDLAIQLTTIVYNGEKFKKVEKSSLKHGDMKLRLPVLIFQGIRCKSNRSNNESREYTVIALDTYEHLRVWQESDIRRDCLKTAETISSLLIRVTKRK